MSDIPTFRTSDFAYRKEDRSLRMKASSFPSRFDVVSDHTGRVVRFRPIGEDHPMFDEDFWDGEMQVYEPCVPQPNCAIAILYAG